MTPSDILMLLVHGNQLKRTQRTGWVMRGIPQAENVAAHSYGVSHIALILAHYIEEEIDLGKALSLAILHDLPEGITTDIPKPAWSFLPAGAKREAEQKALDTILQPDRAGRLAAHMQALWQELGAKATPEARLIKDADQLDMYLQAAQYQKSFGNRALDEFWKNEPVFFFSLSQTIYELIRDGRNR